MHSYELDKKKYPSKQQNNLYLTVFFPYFDTEQKGKLLNILCAATQNCKAILTLSTKSLQYVMAVHIVNLRALEKRYKWFSLENKTQHFTAFIITRGSRSAVGRSRA